MIVDVFTAVAVIDHHPHCVGGARGTAAPSPTL